MSVFIEQAKKMTFQTYSQLKTAVELGKFPDGKIVSEEQKKLMLEALIIYEQAHLPEDQHIGAMDSQCASKTTATEKASQSSSINTDELH